jgi:hypothetical protein
MGLARNPGVTGLWITRSFTLFSDDHGRSLIRLGQPEEVEWWARGRQATLKEVEASIESGYPILRKVAAQQGDDALQELAAQRRAAAGYLPAA